MKIQRIYIDTSVIGGCFDAEFSQWSKGLLKDFKKGLFIPAISEITQAEILDAPDNVKEIYEEFLQAGSQILPISNEAYDLADAYQRRKILTPKFYDDGMHIALATIAEVDLLVSWNFKHIVHFDKIRMFNSVNLERGYKPLQIFSPREVTYYEGR